MDMSPWTPFVALRLMSSHSTRRKLSELPIQLQTKFEMAVNLKTAKALGLTLHPA
jgi:hypothetical protein